MFLGNLSSANEHKARKKSSGKKKSENDEGIIDEPSLRRLRSSDKPVLYKAGDEIPRLVLLDFLKSCHKMMLTQHNIEEIVDDSISKDLAMNLAAVEFQRDVLENNFQIEKDFGCKYLSMIPMKYDGDDELLEAAKEFMFTAMKSYCNAMKVRSNRYRADPSLKPKANTPLRKKDILEFFEGCNALMAMPETKQELKLIYKQTGQPPGPRVIELQRGVLVQMGFDPDFGVACLNKVGEMFPNDREIMGKMQLYATCAETSCMIATFTEQQHENFFKIIPPLMHHFPHMFVMQQRMQQQQQLAQQQQQQYQNQSQGQPSSSAANRLNEIEALKQSGILSLLSSPDGRLQMQELAGKVQASKNKLAEDVPSWTADKRSDYFNNIAEHPIMTKLMDAATPGDKIKAFLDMSDDDIDSMMTLMLVVSEDSSLLSSSSSNGNNNAVVGGIMTTLGSLMNFNKFGPGAQQVNAPPLMRPSSTVDDHDHSHSHSHEHGGSCSHHHAPMPARKDISSGSAESIDR